MSMNLSECQTTESQPAGKSAFSTTEQKNHPLLFRSPIWDTPWNQLFHQRWSPIDNKLLWSLLAALNKDDLPGKAVGRRGTGEYWNSWEDSMVGGIWSAPVHWGETPPERASSIRCVGLLSYWHHTQTNWLCSSMFVITICWETAYSPAPCH